MKEGPGKRGVLSRPASKKAAARPLSAPRNEPKLVSVSLPEGVRDLGQVLIFLSNLRTVPRARLSC